LAVKGARLNETAKERQNRVYADDIIPRIEVVGKETRLVVDKFDNHSPIVYHGEHRRILARLVNTGETEVNEIWLVPGRQDRLCVLLPGDDETGGFFCTAEFLIFTRMYRWS
jgi:hypothetical protein